MPGGICTANSSARPSPCCLQSQCPVARSAHRTKSWRSNSVISQCLRLVTAFYVDWSGCWWWREVMHCTSVLSGDPPTSPCVIFRNLRSISISIWPLLVSFQTCNQRQSSCMCERTLNENVITTVNQPMKNIHRNSRTVMQTPGLFVLFVWTGFCLNLWVIFWGLCRKIHSIVIIIQINIFLINAFLFSIAKI